ncbi:uncharacterized protein LOC128680491 [Plodia interpunctella]|uniref:uncharacterized protein LOC128680491 n=1 Tax=Plodia interpunctella TaxID=58824 RepID=UPI0023676F9F|nr:uncharacterized protein LOC128680491 [Plodia interpunctella]
MKMSGNNNEEHVKLQMEVIQRENQEKSAVATVTAETLKKLNVSIEELPQKCQQLLQRAAETQASMDSDIFDPIAVSLQQSREISEKLTDEYEILKLRQKNQQLQAKIDRNHKFLEGLRRELASSRESLAKQSPNPENILEHVRQMKQKVVSYEESCEKAKAKYSNLGVPDSILPKSLLRLIGQLSSLQDSARTLQERAEDVTLARQARDTLHRLRR